MSVCEVQGDNVLEFSQKKKKNVCKFPNSFAETLKKTFYGFSCFLCDSKMARNTKSLVLKVTSKE